MSNFFVELNYLDLMSVRGVDSEKFLQGQLTCDIETVSSERSSLAAVCDTKGRVIANFRLCKLQYNNQDSYFLEMQPGVLALLKPVLEKYGVFYKSTLEDASSNFRRYGLVGSKSIELISPYFPSLPEQVNQVIHNDNNHLIKLPGPQTRHELWLDLNCQNDIALVIEQELPKAQRSEWERLDIQAGLFQIEVEDSGLNTPQVLNYDLAGLISFDKGCYTGQEIVARMHYRGKAKKRLYRLAINSSQTIQSKDIVQLNNSSTMGEVLKVQKNQNNDYDALALLKTEVENIDPRDNLTINDYSDTQIKAIKPDYAWH